MVQLHCTRRPGKDTSALFSYSLHEMWRSIPEIIPDTPHFSLRRKVDTLVLCGCCWTTMLMQMSADMMEELRSILQHATVTLTFLGYYLSAVRRLMHGVNTSDVPHFSWHHNLDTSISCGYCSATMRIWKRVTTTKTLRLFVEHTVANLGLFKYCWIEMRRSIRQGKAVLLRYKWHQGRDI